MKIINPLSTALYATIVTLLLFALSSPAATFPSWQSSRFTPAQLSNPSASGTTADPDNDSFANLAEYAFALEPFTANSTREALGISLATPATAGMLFTYVQRKDATDLLYQIEYTDDITQPLWNLLTNPQEPTAALDLGPVWQRTIAVPPHFTTREFLRLRLHQSTSPVILNDPPQQFYLRLHEPFLDIDLRWVDRSNQETGYRIERRADNTSSWTYVGTTDYDARYFRDVHLASDTLYHYRARAVLYDGSFGVSSSEKTLRTPLDSDGDNLPDWFELKIGTSISNPDSDGDGLSDSYEVSSGTRSYGYADIGNGQKETLPQPIEDLDGNPTGEMTNGAPGDPYFNPSNGDSDNNGIPDGEEDWDLDSAGNPAPDGLTNADEYVIDTDPFDPDTDDDGKKDGEEAVPTLKQITAPAAPETRYAIIDLGATNSVGSALGLNDLGQVLVNNSSGYRVWTAGSFSAPFAGSNAFGPLADGSVHYDEYVNHSTGTNTQYIYTNHKVITFSSTNTSTTTAGTWSESYTSMFPAVNGSSGLVTGTAWSQLTTSYQSQWSLADALRGDQHLEDPSDTGADEIGFGTVITGINDAGVLTLYAAAGRASYHIETPFYYGSSGLSGWLVPSTSQTTLAAIGAWYGASYYNDIDNVSHISGSFLQHFKVNADQDAIATRTSGQGQPQPSVKLLGKEWAPLPDGVTPIDLTPRLAGEGPYIVGNTESGGRVWCSKDDILYHFDLDNFASSSGSTSNQVTGRKISNTVVIPLGNAGIWRNGRTRSVGDLIGANPLYTDWSITQVTPKNNLLLATAKFHNPATPTAPPDSHAILLIPFEVVRKNKHEKYQSFEDIPIMVHGNGVGYGAVTVPSNTTPDFTIKISASLNPLSIDALDFSTNGQQAMLTETANDSKIFVSSGGAIKIEVLSTITFNENGYDTFSVRYTNTSLNVSNQLNSLAETENLDVFRSMRFQMSVAFAQAPSASQVDTVKFTVTNSEVGDTISDTLVETGIDTLVFSDSTSSISVNLVGTLSSTQINNIDVEANFPSIKVSAVALSLRETTSNSLVFTNFASGTTAFANATTRNPSEKVEIFRVRRYSGQTANTIQMTVKTSVEEKPITLTRATGDEFLSEKMILIGEGENVTEIPEALLYTTIQVTSDASQTSKEVTFKDDVLQQTLEKVNAIKPAYIAHSFSEGVLKQQGDVFVDLWKAGVPDKLGWALTGNAADYSATKAKFLEALPKSSFLAWFGHGLRTKDSTAFTGLHFILPNGGIPGTADELRNAELPVGLGYEFVFINGCGSATPNNAEANGLIQKFNAKAYLGWSAPAGGAAAGIFANKLLAELDSQNRVIKAVPDAWNKVSSIVKVAALAQSAPGTPSLVWKADMSVDEKQQFFIDRKK